MTFANENFFEPKEEKTYQTSLSVSVPTPRLNAMIASAQAIFPLTHFEQSGSAFAYNIGLIGSNKEQLGLIVNYLKSLI